MIKHKPSFDVARIADLYSKKDGVEVKYVCTTEIQGNNTPCDVFFRETPHPTFGNRYFAIFQKFTGETFIKNADEIETYEFAMAKDKNDEYNYSRFRHDFVSLDTGNFVDGGRSYCRTSGHVTWFKIIDGEFVPTNGDSHV